MNVLSSGSIQFIVVTGNNIQINDKIIVTCDTHDKSHVNGANQDGLNYGELQTNLKCG